MSAKRYLAWIGDWCDPAGPVTDFVGGFDSLDEARALFDSSGADWFRVFDTQTADWPLLLGEIRTEGLDARQRVST